MCRSGVGVGREGEGEPYSSRIEAPPPVPVTHPSVQNLAQREGMRFAGWSGLSDWTSESSLVLMAGSCVVSSLAQLGGWTDRSSRGKGWVGMC